MYLMGEQAAAGEICRGNVLPVIDNLGSWPGTMDITDEQRIIYDADHERYREMYPNCDAHRWSMAGSRATHCGYCCPPIPMSRDQAENFQCSLPPSPSVGRKNSISGQLGLALRGKAAFLSWRPIGLPIPHPVATPMGGLARTDGPHRDLAFSTELRRSPIWSAEQLCNFDEGLTPPRCASLAVFGISNE